ncbi:hypothetical protein FQR65_LT19229 [Abscondita terminalis]|nr:hypothetical protein FQR65_LT19229 [Abscondita terminalis]
MSQMKRITINYGGDSNLRRYLKWIKKKSQYKTSTNKIAVELAIGGQTISQLHKRLKRCQSKNYTFKIGRKITLLIGSNDILKGHSFTTMRKGITRVLSLLKSSEVNDVRLITLPPYQQGSKLQHNKIKSYNKFMLRLRYPNVTVIDLYRCIQDYGGDFFETDGIHLNMRGMLLLKDLLQ